MDGRSAPTAGPFERVQPYGGQRQTGAGLDQLERQLTQLVRERLDTDEAPLVTRARHGSWWNRPWRR